MSLYRKSYTLYRGKDSIKKLSKRACYKNTSFWKEEIVNVNKRRAKTTSLSNKLLHLWKKKFAKSKHLKVWDHCHYISKYSGAAHSICNLIFNVPNKFPGAFHIMVPIMQLSFYHKRIINRVWEKISMSWGKCRKEQTFFVLTEKKNKKNNWQKK